MKKECCIEENSPWLNSELEIAATIEKYINLEENGFSWILKEDEKYISDKSKSSVRFGIPNQVIGNKSDAELYICLYNPSTQIGYKKIEDIKKNERAHYEGESLKEYIDSEKSFSKLEFFENNDEYMKHIESKENVLFQEIKKMSENLPNEFFNNDEIKKYYYLYQYYYPLFDKKRVTAFNKILGELNNNNKKEVEVYLNKIRDLKICNVELVPYRSKQKGDIKFTNKFKTHNDLISSRYSISIVMNRILETLIKDKDEPMFIFRSYKQWIEGIQAYFEENKNIINTKLTENGKSEIIFKDILKYFYVFKNPQSARISKDNIVKLIQLEDEKYKELEDMFQF